MRILIPESQAMGSVACIRSLGRAGHTVIALSPDPVAWGFASRFCDETVVQPSGLSGDAWARWLANLVASRQIDLILPSEGLVAALGPAISQFSNHLPVGPDAQRLERFISKFELFTHFETAGDAELRRNLPPMRLLRDGDPWQGDLTELTLPLFAKFDAVPALGLSALVQRYDSHQAALDGLPPLLARYRRGLLQQFAGGQGVGVFFLRWKGQVLASLMHRRLHEVPHTGGVSSYRETWWDEALYQDALRRIESLDWWGVGMLEYRWSAVDGRFQLMEFNARFWGSLHLALYAGVDFPRLLVDAWGGRPVEPVRAKVGVRCRFTFPKDIEHLWSVWCDPALGLGRKAGALAKFLALGLDPRLHSDLWFPGDHGLYWRALRSTPGKFLRRG